MRVLRVKVRELEVSKELIMKLKTLNKEVFFVSFCPQARFWARGLDGVRVLNPFQYYLWPSLLFGVVWWHEWPSFIGDRWRECRHHLLAGHCQQIFHQSFSVPQEDHFAWKYFSCELGDFLYQERVPRLPLVRKGYRVLERYEGECRRGLLIHEPHKWPIKGGRELFIPFCLRDHSELYALASRHRILLGTYSEIWEKSLKKQSLCMLWALWDELFAWNLSGRVQGDLLKWWGENKGRGDPHSQSALSRAARHWYTSFKKWQVFVSAFLRRSGWWKKAQGVYSGAWLHDEDRAIPYESDQRAA